MANTVKFSKWKAFGKGLGPALGAYFAAHMAGVDLGKIIEDPEGQLPVIASTLIAGLIPVIINTWKHRGKAGNPIPMLPILLALGLGALTLQACVTTRSVDGTVTTSIDPAAVDTAFATWDRLEARRKALDAEKARAEAARDAARVAMIEAELAKLGPVLEAAWERVQGRVEVSVTPE